MYQNRTKLNEGQKSLNDFTTEVVKVGDDKYIVNYSNGEFTKKANQPKGFIINLLWDGGYYRKDKYGFPTIEWGPNGNHNGDKGTFPSMCGGLYYNGELKSGVIIR